MKRKALSFLPFAAVLVTLSMVVAQAWTAVPVADDPLVRMPGTQPEQVTLEGSGRCLNCHAGYNTAVEPGYNWKGSMMAQSARDFLFLACLTVAGQDSIWAVGTPNAVDICERCHFPKGWLEGRSDPPNASAMAGDDYDGVQCDFCHTLYDPFFQTTYNGTREGSDWEGYWDETNDSDTPSAPAAEATYQEDRTQAEAITLFNGGSFFVDDQPPTDYTENAGGQYFVSSNSDKRASFADAAARHQMLYSRYHKSKYFCSTCHDVSNPVLANLGEDGTVPLATETESAYAYFHVERTFSEFMLSAYGQQGGAATNQDFRDQGAPGIPHASKCQDCHMRDVVGVGCDKSGVPVRPDDSIEHPNSGQPLHDMTGGNMWVSAVLASAVPGSPNYDPANDALLNQGPAVLTLDLTQGEGIDPAALLAGVDRSRQQLLLAATIKNVNYDPVTGDLSFRVQNNTAHKLISGFPEGRRMFVNVRAYSGESLIHEVNPYDPDAETLKGLDYPHQPGLGLPDPQSPSTNEVYVDELVYEMKPSSTDLTGETKTFHFALATGRYKDNRIPPKSFDISGAADRLSAPVWNGVEVPEYFTAEEYAGGYDDVSLTIPAGADYVEVNLYYQTTSREYVEFLRDEINGTGNLTLTGTGEGGDPPYIVQTDPFFDQLKAWGDTIWQLWTHNVDDPGAAPFLMAQATAGETAGGCTAPVPNLLAAAAGHKEVALTWSDESADGSVAGYKVYYDQAGKAQFIVDITDPATTVFTDTGLTNGEEYCYKVTSYYDVACESDFSNVLCATPTPEATLPAVFAKISPTDGAAAQPTDLTLSWGVSSGAESYEYCIDETDDDTCDDSWIGVGADTSMTPSGLSIGTTYYWQVRAVNTAGTAEADGGAWWDFTTQVSAPGAFGKTGPADGAAAQPTDPTLNWEASSGAESYEYCIDDIDNHTCDGGWIDAGASTSANLSGLSTDANYYWQVRAVNPADITEADGGAWWYFTTQVLPPVAFGKTGPTDGAAAQPTDPTLSWGTSSGAESYEYCIDVTDNDACDAGWTSVGADTSVDLSGLSGDATYYWQVRARNPAYTTEADGGAWWHFATEPGAFRIYIPAVIRDGD
jgi:hypothetical protein